MHFVATYCFYLNSLGLSFLHEGGLSNLNVFQQHSSTSVSPSGRISALSAYELKSRLADDYDILKLNRKLVTVAMERQLSQSVAANGCVWFVEFGLLDTVLAGVDRAFKIFSKDMCSLLGHSIRSSAIAFRNGFTLLSRPFSRLI
jgi:hypothetical protein